MRRAPAAKPKVGISACLLGERVRYDGGHKQDDFLAETLGPVVEWVLVCPEVELGMGVPREAIRLVARTGALRLIGERSGRDWTDAMQAYAAERVAALAAMGLSGYVLKAGSPSCGVAQVRVYGTNGAFARTSRGAFARVLIDASPRLPVEDEEQLRDPARCERFLTRVFAYHRRHGAL